MTKEGSTKILSFITPGAGVFVLGHGYIGSEMQYFFYLYLCTLGHGSDKLSI